MRDSVVVIGAGVVGAACALALRARGLPVCLLDARAPAAEASAGNAGVVSTAAVMPQATHATLRGVPAMLLSPQAALRLHWRAAPELVPWLLRFLAAARPEAADANSRALAGLLVGAVSDWHDLLTAAGLAAADAADWIRPVGYAEAYEQADARPLETEKSAFRRRRGVRETWLRGPDADALVPDVSRRFASIVHLPDSAWCPDPEGLVTLMVERFVALGGRYRRARVLHMGAVRGGVRRLETDGVPIEAGTTVVAAGIGSARLAGQAGDRVLLAAQRGYHAMLPRAGVALPFPVAASERHVVLTPMRRGLCVTGVLEMCGPGRAPDWRRARALAGIALQLDPGCNPEHATFWSGVRPATPDSLPVIGRSRVSPDVVHAFGHGAIGLTTAAATAWRVSRLVADDAAGDLEPFAAARFARR